MDEWNMQNPLIEEDDEGELTNEMMVLFYKGLGYEKTNIAYLCEMEIEEVEEILAENDMDSEDE